MPIYRLLQNVPFGPEDISHIESVFEDALRVLRVTDRNDPIAEIVGKKIIEIAQTGERNPVRMRMLALRDFQGRDLTIGSAKSDPDQSAGNTAPENMTMEWKPVSTAPFDCDLELAVINYDGTHALAFACRRILGGWVKAETKRRIDVRPTHWREWSEPKL